jgi:putative PIN family toxin of toxin-antitoxin system
VVVTLDTNIYISALNFRRGKPLQILQMAIDGDLRVAISPAILQEVFRIMDTAHLKICGRPKR